MLIEDTWTLAKLRDFDNHYHAGYDEERYMCPWCPDTKHYDHAHRSLCVNIYTGVYICHRCGVKGKLGGIQQTTDKCRLAKLSARRELQRLKEIRSYNRAINTVLPLANTAGADYLKYRGIGFEIAHACQVRFSHNWYGFRAVLFPIRDSLGKLVAINARYIDPTTELAHRTSRDKKLGVYACKGAWDSPWLILTEAPLDALSLTMIGYPAIALCGDGFPDWLLVMAQNKAVIIASDADVPGDEKADRWLKLVSAVHGIGIRIRPTADKDWNAILMRDIKILARDFIGQLGG